MSVDDDLIALRTLLILRGRAMGRLEDGGNVCLRQGMQLVSGMADRDLVRQYRATYSRSYPPIPFSRDKAMHDALVEYLPANLRAEPEMLVYSPDPNNSILAHFNDLVDTRDEDVLGLIDKALADLGAT